MFGGGRRGREVDPQTGYRLGRRRHVCGTVSGASWPRRRVLIAHHTTIPAKPSPMPVQTRTRETAYTQPPTSGGTARPPLANTVNAPNASSSTPTTVPVIVRTAVRLADSPGSDW